MGWESFFRGKALTSTPRAATKPLLVYKSKTTIPPRVQVVVLVVFAASTIPLRCALAILGEVPESDPWLGGHRPTISV